MHNYVVRPKDINITSETKNVLNDFTTCPIGGYVEVPLKFADSYRDILLSQIDLNLLNYRFQLKCDLKVEYMLLARTSLIELYVRLA